ncbi:hypothetical protein Tco_0333058 [Tanacetum coccineum]
MYLAAIADAQPPTPTPAPGSTISSQWSSGCNVDLRAGMIAFLQCFIIMSGAAPSEVWRGGGATDAGGAGKDGHGSAAGGSEEAAKLGGEWGGTGNSYLFKGVEFGQGGYGCGEGKGWGVIEGGVRGVVGRLSSKEGM